MKVLFITVGSIKNASPRVRVYQFLPKFKGIGIDYKVFPMGEILKTHTETDMGRMISDEWEAADLIYIQKFLLDKNLLKKLKKTNKRIIYDFDDALFTPEFSFEDLAEVKKRRESLNFHLKNAMHVIVSNDYLKNYAKNFNKNVTVIPNAFDIEKITLKENTSSSTCIIGWIGYPGNLNYLMRLRGVFKKIYEKFRDRVILMIISSVPFIFREIKTINKNWSLDREIENIQKFDIGISPLVDSPYTRGKAGYRVLINMAVGNPVVASPVGVQKEVIKDGWNGYLADAESEWIEKMSQLIENPSLRRKFGLNGRKLIINEYSLEKIFKELLLVFRGCLKRPKF
jgi:glycosyltransferase involved in cell wall biosynthesis